MRIWLAFGLICGLATLAVVPRDVARSDEAPALKSAAGGGGGATARPRVSTAEARRQAELLHVFAHAMLQDVHHRYYRLDEGLPLPAAMMKDVFAEVEKEQGVSFRWLAVEGQAMNTDHKPRGAFEEEAFRALAAGKGSLERTENGVYRRAGAITLKNECLKCHVPDRKNTRDRTAGLIIAIPVSDR